MYAERRAKLAAQIDAPVVLWGYTGREEAYEAYIFAQEENFYYLTGHNEEGAGLIILPTKPPAGAPTTLVAPLQVNGQTVPIGQEMFFLPAKDPAKEKWNGVRLAPTDADIQARTGFT